MPLPEDFLHANQIYFGQVCSLISYLLGTTHVDHLEHDLYFRRFLNPERMTPPDIGRATT